MNKVFDFLKGDKAIWVMIMILSLVSIAEVYSSTSMLAYKYKGGNTVFYMLRHLGFMALGFTVMFLASHFPYKYYHKLAAPMLWTAVVLLLLTLFTGASTNEARRWFTIPFVGVKFQTSDFAKVALMIYLAKVITKAQESPEALFDGFKKSIIAIGLVCGLILPANFSTAFLIGVASLVVLFMGKMKSKWLLSTIGIAIVAFMLFIAYAKISGIQSRVGTWSKRIETFFSPKDNHGDDFQAQQSKIAIALGGIFGKGPGNSQQRNVLPHPYSDFIFAVIVEEGGLAGAIGIIAVYLIFFYRCIATVKKCETTFPAFLVLGLSLNIILQAVANMLVAVNITPVTGQPLPFVSMGGTSMLFNSFAVGVIVNVSRYAGKQETVEDIEEKTEVEEIEDYPFIAG
ncbi:MAG: FtsW/RodA/SpoVE family cell cycle protein [Bacteroidales bacterium]|nr:FtsW/RodA/SpoVE family cell cycle protein [Bacteroidales bacterium]